MTVISLDSITYLLTYLQQLARGVVGLMHCHTHMPQNLQTKCGYWAASGDDRRILLPHMSL